MVRLFGIKRETRRNAHNVVEFLKKDTALYPCRNALSTLELLGEMGFCWLSIIKVGFVKKDPEENALKPAAQEKARGDGEKTGSESMTVKLMRLDSAFKEAVAKALISESAGQTGLKRIVPVIETWVDGKGFSFISFLIPKARKKKKANKLAGQLLDFLEEIVEADGKAYLDLRRERPYKHEVGVLHFNAKKLLTTLESLSTGFSKASNVELQKARACFDRMGGYTCMDYKPQNRLH